MSAGTVPKAHYFNCRFFFNKPVHNSVGTFKNFAECLNFDLWNDLPQAGMVLQYVNVRYKFPTNAFSSNGVIDCNVCYDFFEVLRRPWGEEDRDAHEPIFASTFEIGILSPRFSSSKPS